MNPQSIEQPPLTGSRKKLLDAVTSSIREKGYAATGVDEICGKAGVTKGAFFHYFPSKKSAAIAAVDDWSKKCDAFFAAAAYHQFDDPLDRVLAYLDFRKTMVRGPIAEITCIAGTMIQEVYNTHPDILQACHDCIASHAATVEADIAEAMKRYRIREPWTAESLAQHTLVVLHGAIIMAKAKENIAVVEESIDHLRCYIELLFRSPKTNPHRSN